jgi:hypothetical protein
VEDIDSMAHWDVRANPCLGSEPRPENWGQQTGTPPRMGLPGSNDALDRKSRSSPSAARHEVTCAPCT